MTRIIVHFQIDNMIIRSKPQKSVFLIFCDSTYFIFNKLETVAIARLVMFKKCSVLITGSLIKGDTVGE